MMVDTVLALSWSAFIDYSLNRRMLFPLRGFINMIGLMIRECSALGNIVLFNFKINLAPRDVLRETSLLYNR